MNRLKTLLNQNKWILLSAATVLFFFFGQGVTWYAMGGDTEAYYIYFGHHIEVKPIYPLFFHILDGIFGRGLYLYVAAVIQILVTIFCVLFFDHYVCEHLHLNLFGIAAFWLSSLFPFIILLPENPVPHVLMTESLTYPLIYLFITILLKGIWEHRERYFYYSIGLATFMTLIRGQMLFLMAVAIVVYFYFLLKENRKFWASMIKFAAAMIVLTLLQSILTTGYEKVFFDAPKQDYSAQTFVQKALFCADAEDEELFQDEVTKEIFRRTYKGMDEGKANYKYPTGDLWDWKHTVRSFGDNSYLVQDVIRDVLTEKGTWPEDKIEQENQVLYYSRELTGPLFKIHFLRALKVSFSLMPAGFICTVLAHKESIYGLIHVMTAVLYVMAISGSILISKLNRKIAKESEFMWLVLLTAIGNVVSANLMHFGIQRYLAYTVGMFWGGGFLLLRFLWIWILEKRRLRKKN